MTRLVFSGFETGFENATTKTSGAGTSITYDATIHRGGADRSVKFTVTAAQYAALDYTISGVVNRSYFSRVYIYIATLPATRTEDLMTYVDSTGTINILGIRLKTDGNLDFYNHTTATVLATTSTAPAQNTWHKIEMAYQDKTGSLGNEYMEFRLNNEVIYVTQSGNADNGPIKLSIGVGNSVGNDTCTVYFDDLAINDDQGSNNNTWPPDEVVVFLKPTSDNARGANWTGGAGGTTNLWDAVNNIPPVGVANASATNTSQIKNAASDSSGNYDANIETYASKGIVPGNKITAVQGVWNIGCSSATSTSGATHVVSNPAEGAETSINFSNGVGAVGTWSSNWKGQWNTIIENPSVTFTTAPVLRIGKRQATTRIGHCDQMGLSVAYSPIVERKSVITQAVNRAAVI